MTMKVEAFMTDDGSLHRDQSDALWHEAYMALTRTWTPSPSEHFTVLSAIKRLKEHPKMQQAFLRAILNDEAARANVEAEIEAQHDQ